MGETGSQDLVNALDVLGGGGEGEGTVARRGGELECLQKLFKYKTIL